MQWLKCFVGARGLNLDLAKAKSFYGIIVIAIFVGIGLNFAPIDPIKALFWSAVINGVVAVPVMTAMMLMSRRKDIMGPFIIGKRTMVVGWITTSLMAVMVVAMFATFEKS